MSTVYRQNGEKLSLADIHQGLRTQLRVWNALILRETKTRYGRHKLGFFWMFVEPAFFVGMFLVFKMFTKSEDSAGMSDVYFIITGITPFLLFRQTMGSLANSIQVSTSLLAFPQVTTLDVMMASALLEFATNLLMFGAFVSIAAIVYEVPRIESPLLVLYGTLLLGISGMGVGLLFASLSPIWPSIKNIAQPLMGRPLFFTSGVFFTASMMPKSVREVLLWNPLLHMVEMIRSGFFIEFESRYVDYQYATLFAFGTLFFGLLVHQVLKDLAVKLS